MESNEKKEEYRCLKDLLVDPEYGAAVIPSTLFYDPEAEVVEDELFEQWLEETEQRERKKT